MTNTFEAIGSGRNRPHGPRVQLPDGGGGMSIRGCEQCLDKLVPIDV